MSQPVSRRNHPPVLREPVERLADTEAHEQLYELISDEVAEAFTGVRDDDLRERVREEAA